MDVWFASLCISLEPFFLLAQVMRCPRTWRTGRLAGPPLTRHGFIPMPNPHNTQSFCLSNGEARLIANPCSDHMPLDTHATFTKYETKSCLPKMFFSFIARASSSENNPMTDRSFLRSQWIVYLQQMPSYQIGMKKDSWRHAMWHSWSVMV